MNQAKKYYSVGEVSKLLGMRPHNLRYADALLGRKLTMIRGRRHYTSADIETIRVSLGKAPRLQTQHRPSNIDDLINSLQLLRAQLVAAIDINWLYV